MKRMTTICVLLAMLISILCGCTKPAAEVPLTEATEAKEELVSTETTAMAKLYKLLRHRNQRKSLSEQSMNCLPQLRRTK